MAVDVSGFIQLKKELNELQNGLDKAITKAAKEAAEYLIGQCVMRTPVYSPTTIKGKVYHAYDHGSQRIGGALRQAWIDDNNKLVVHKQGDSYYVIVQNNNEYASFVEDGHKQHVGQMFPVYINGKLEYRRHKKAWIEGQHFLKLSEEDLKGKLPSIVEKHIEAYIKGVLND